jgi:hypothetical protein
MIVKEDDELSAFPWVCDDPRIVAKGMALRDYFAAKAMQALLTNDKDAAAPDSLISKGAYEIANAMMKAREQ